ncbi:MAG TPA: nitroreductase family protein [Planctomycetes bacterium]|nr:nitroreductase family protein [Planctomycetota bacterium]HIN80262.1 nitroreductase family protein [Planctomycetota bacterium]
MRVTTEYRPIPHEYERLDESEMERRSAELLAALSRRRSVRAFSDEPVPRVLIERAIESASTAPSGAHRQPWRFVVVDDAAIKSEIRAAAEKEEQLNYDGRMPKEWLDALKPLGTGIEKPFLESAPYLVVLFAQTHVIGDDGESRPNYYVFESVGIAAGFFILALHLVGLATLTHTPSPMGFLRDILGRPKNERPYLLFPVGYPEEGCSVPEIERKALAEILDWNRPPNES